MPRTLLLALGSLVLVVAGVGFFVGYLGALDKPPAAGDVSAPPAELPGAATYLGTVESVGDELVVIESGGARHSYPSGNVKTDATVEASIDDFAEGDLVIVAVESDAFGGPAIRYLVTRPGGGASANP